MGPFDELLALAGTRANPPATEAAMSAVTDHFGVALPEDLQRLWRSADGLAVPAVGAEILGCAQVLEFMRQAGAAPGLQERGWLPLIDDHTSNYLCLALKPPLAPRVVELPHDDGPSLKFRNLESALTAMLASQRAGESFDIHRHEHEGDFDGVEPRTPQDQADAVALLASGGEAHEWSSAAQLLDENNLEQLARLLETDHFVRRDVLARLRRMQSLEVRKLLGRDRKAFADFAAAVSIAVQGAGLKVGKLNGSVLPVGRCHIQLETFFYKRNEPGAMERIVARIQELAA